MAGAGNQGYNVRSRDMQVSACASARCRGQGRGRVGGGETLLQLVLVRLRQVR